MAGVGPAVGQGTVDGRGRYPGAGRELDEPLTQALAQRDDPLDHCLGCAVGARARAAGAVGHGPAGPVPVDPALDGGPGALEPGSDLADGPALLDHQAGDPHTSTRGQGRVSVGHQESTFRVWLTGAATPPLNQPKALSSPQRLGSHPPQPTLPTSTPKDRQPPTEFADTLAAGGRSSHHNQITDRDAGKPLRVVVL